MCSLGFLVNSVLPNTALLSKEEVLRFLKKNVRKIQKYIESNEVFVEVDWQSEIDKASTDLELNYIPFNNDTN